MHIRELSLRPFRNLKNTRLSFAPDGVLIVAPNGSGKSNVLEAISFLSIGKSVRGDRDREAVPHGGNQFEILGVCHNGKREYEVRLCYLSDQGKRVFLDGAPLDRVSDLVSLFQTVHFCPEDVTLVLRFAAQRRRLLDILISQSDAAYLHDLQRFQRALVQRNRCLKRWQSAAECRRELEPWDVQIVQFGGSLRQQRLGVLLELQPLLTNYFARFSTGREALNLTYSGTTDIALGSRTLPSREELCAELREELDKGRERERLSGHTQCGPHRDVISFELNGEPAERYASQGQRKSLLIAWKMAELRFLEARNGQQPVLLLDDMFSELDEERTRELLNLVADFGQVVITAPKPPHENLPACFTEVSLTDDPG